MQQHQAQCASTSFLPRHELAITSESLTARIAPPAARADKGAGFNRQTSPVIQKRLWKRTPHVVALLPGDEAPSGSGRFAESRVSSFSPKISKLTLSRLISSSQLKTWKRFALFARSSGPTWAASSRASPHHHSYGCERQHRTQTRTGWKLQPETVRRVSRP